MDSIDQYFIFGLFWAFFGAILITTTFATNTSVTFQLGTVLLIVGTIAMVVAMLRKEMREKKSSVA
jgi:uncharacterized membrane protein HdeD (DUF308 family)